MNRKTAYLVDVMSGFQKVILGLWTGLWVASLAVFWVWWFDGSHLVTWGRLIANSLVLCWTMLLPGYFLFFLWRMKKFNPQLEIPSNWKVAIVVTKAPSEPWSVLKKTLLAMINQAYPHDTWLADEDPSTETLTWCKEHGVFVSCRKGIPEYNRDTWPRRKKCKEGNLTYFYDMFGYEKYEIVVQLDADHVPAAGYLEEMIRPFIDARVGYVSAPSICDANASISWAARGRLYLEAALHGAQQAGHTNGFAPLCFGSHYAVRTEALKQIGGLGPELAEDHSTTLIMNAHGWKGVHAMDAVAHGDGPRTFADAMTQEFQWSKSLAVILISITKHYWKGLSWHKQIQFGFSQMWYPLFGLILLFSYLTPIVALVTGIPWVRVPYVTFALLSGVNTVLLVGLLGWVKMQGWLRPFDAKVVSWESVLFQLMRWPWILLGSISGIITGLQSKPFEFKVTPKGVQQNQPIPFGVLVPYFILILINVLVGLLPITGGEAAGYYYFLIMNIVCYFVATLLVVFRHWIEQDYVLLD